MIRAAFFFLAAATMPLAAAQAESRIEPHHLSEERFQEIAAPIRLSLQPGGNLEKLSASARNEVLQGLEKIERILADDNGNERRRDRLVSREAERVNLALAALTTSDGSDVVCRRERTIGSNMSHRVCRSRAEMEAEREAVRETLHELDRR